MGHNKFNFYTETTTKKMKNYEIADQQVVTWPDMFYEKCQFGNCIIGVGKRWSQRNWLPGGPMV